MSITTTLSEAHQSLFAAKSAKGLSFEAIASQMGRGEVWVASIFYGQAKPTKEDLESLSKILDVPYANLETTMGESFFPERGLGSPVPRDPLLYRLYEIVAVFGWPLKSIIHEKFGDGIMSAIDFRADVEKVQVNGVDRVKITLNGKWLPYSKW